MNTPRLSKFKLNVLHITAAAALASSLVCLPLAHAQEAKSAATAIAVDESVTMTIRKGDNVREIAKKYSRTHNTSFKTTLVGLLAANPNAFFKNDPNILIVGAPFVLPGRSQLLGLQPLEVVDPSKVEVTTPTAVVLDEKKAIEPIPAPTNQTVPVAAPAVTAPLSNVPTSPAKTEVGAATDGGQFSLDSMLPMPIWAMCLMGIALLMLCVRIFRRSKKEPLLDVDEDKDQSSDLSPPNVHLDLTTKDTEISLSELLSSAEGKGQVNGVDHGVLVSNFVAEPVAEPAVVREKRFEKVEFESNLLESAEVKMVQRDATSNALLTESSISMISPIFARNTFGNVDIEAIIADINIEANRPADVHQAVERFAIEEPAIEEPAIEEPAIEEPAIEAPSVETMTSKDESITPLSKGLDLDVSGFMKRYTNQIPPMRVQPSLDFEDLLDRAHLQAWLNQNTPEDVLLHAQDAHEERYGEVAEAMLADVLFRGDAEQCSMAIRLRKEWSTPRPL